MRGITATDSMVMMGCEYGIFWDIINIDVF